MYMANKKETVDNLLTVEALKEKYDTTDVIFVGVSTKKEWVPGKMISESEYVKAVAEFLKAPLGRR
jgi:hypothetical protein